MARAVRFAVVGLLLAQWLPAQSRSAGTGQRALVFAQGKGVPAGTHKAIVETTDGSRIAVRIEVEEETRTAGGEAQGVPSKQAETLTAVPTERPLQAAPRAALQPAAPQPQELPVWLLGVAAVVPTLLVGGGLWYYFKIVVAAKLIRQYGEALLLVNDERYAAALSALTAVEGRLPTELRVEARFFIAFVNAKLKNIRDAIHQAASLHREDASNVNAAYLLAWLYLTDKQYEVAERVLDAMDKAGELGMKDAKRLMSCAKFARAMAAYRVGSIDQAAEFFAAVQKLGHFTDRIPADLRDRHAALGAKALFERDAQAARSQFEALEKAGAAGGGYEGRSMLLKAKVGLALVAWVDADTKGTEAAIETNLGEAVRLLSTDEPLERVWPDKVDVTSAASRLESLENAKSEATEARLLRLRLRDLHFLRGMAVLRGWKRLERESAQKEVPARYKGALSLMACARAHDPEFSHVYLVAGLLMYYLRSDPADRMRGVDLLDAARKIDLREPEALEILYARDKAEEGGADARTKYMDMLDKYVTDETVRSEIRKELLAHLSRYRRFTGPAKPPDISAARSVPPTVDELRNRSELLRMRVIEIIESGETKDVDKIRTMTASADEETKRLWELAQTVERRQAELMTATGDHLFKD